YLCTDSVQINAAPSAQSDNCTARPGAVAKSRAAASATMHNVTTWGRDNQPIDELTIVATHRQYPFIVSEDVGGTTPAVATMADTGNLGRTGAPLPEERY